MIKQSPNSVTLWLSLAFVEKSIFLQQVHLTLSLPCRAWTLASHPSACFSPLPISFFCLLMPPSSSSRSRTWSYPQLDCQLWLPSTKDLTHDSALVSNTQNAGIWKPQTNKERCGAARAAPQVFSSHVGHAPLPRIDGVSECLQNQGAFEIWNISSLYP